ncbi:MAG: hypothetical protein ACT4OT_08380 [Acidobacteriota bacterium]
MNISRPDKMLVLCLALFFACAPAVFGQGAIELTSADIDRIEFKGLMPTKTEQRALVSFHVSDATKNRAKAAGISLPQNISVAINGEQRDAKLSGDQSFYSTEIRTARRLRTDQSMAFTRKDSGVVADPNGFYIEFGPCQKGCQSIIFRTRCIVCVKKFGWK